MANNSKQLKRGVVILFAVLLVSLVLTVSLGIFNITYRQLVLSSLARESEVAFAVADSARNCALYWNSSERAVAQRPFGYYKTTYDQSTDSFFTTLEPSAPAGNNLLTCAEISPPVSQADIIDGSLTLRTSTVQLRFEITDPAGGLTRNVCANIRVEKNTDATDQKTTIIVDGYNLAAAGAGDCTPTDINRAVQRTIQTVING